MFLLLNSNPNSIVWLAVILLIVGLVLLIKGGDFFVDASVWLAEVFKMPKFLIGATIVSIATTIPELLVSIFGVIDGQVNIAIGNAVGSVTANTGLILALSAIFVRGTVDRKDFGIKTALIMIAGVILLIASNVTGGRFTIFPSILLLIVLVVHITETIIAAKKSQGTDSADEAEVKKDGKTITINILKFIFGIAGIVVGADLLKDNSEILAKAMGISDTIIAITIVAIGTSLPELITTIISIVKKQGELGVGNIVGANIIDLVLILPICSFISNGNLAVNDQSRFLDMPALLVITAIATIPTLITKKFHLWQGILMLALYITYLALAVVFFGTPAI